MEAIRNQDLLQSDDLLLSEGRGEPHRIVSFQSLVLTLSKAMVRQEIDFLDAQWANESREGMCAFRGVVPSGDDGPADDDGSACLGKPAQVVQDQFT